MKNSIKNPFRFGDPVEGAYYLDRPNLRKTVLQFVDNKIHVVLIGPRRTGKTSFVLDLIKHIESDGTPTLFLDIFNITSHRDFLNQLLRAIRRKKTWNQQITDALKCISRLIPKINFDIDPATGQSGFSISSELSNEKDVKDAIQDTMAGIGEAFPRIVLVIDEFQKVAELEDGGWLEATLRTQMQELKNTAFLFTGSRKSVIHDMLNNPARPLYRSCQPIVFPTFGEEFTHWILERFKSVGIIADSDAITELRTLVQDTPNYVQMACFHLVANQVSHVGKTEVQDALRTIVRQNSYAYQTLLNSLTLTQQRALRLAAKESEQVFAREHLLQYEIPSAPTLAAIIKALKRKQILDEGTAKGVVIFDDPLFAIWLRTEFAD